jgi:hypothetical protein
MTDTEHILVNSGLSAEDTTRKLAEILGAHVITVEDGGIAWSREVTSDADRLVIGHVVANDLGRDDPAPGWESIYDGYDLVVRVWIHGRSDEELLHAEAGRVFDEITGSLPWPAVHTHVGGLLYAAWTPAAGRTDFPPNTGYDGSDRNLWAPYARP